MSINTSIDSETRHAIKQLEIYLDSDDWGSVIEENVACAALSALREKAERDNPQPLTLDALRERAQKADPRNNPDWVWYQDLENDNPYLSATGYKVIMPPVPLTSDKMLFRFATAGAKGGAPENYGKTFLIYPSQPKVVHEIKEYSLFINAASAEGANHAS